MGDRKEEMIHEDEQISKSGLDYAASSFEPVQKLYQLACESSKVVPMLNSGTCGLFG